MKIVLDTNCLIQIVTGRGYKNAVWESFLKKEYVLCYTTEILCEYEEVLNRFFRDAELTKAVLQILLTGSNTERIDPSFRFRLITEDPDDNKFVDCAIIAGATYIVSNDRHYNVLKAVAFPKTDVKRLKEFADILKSKTIKR